VNQFWKGVLVVAAVGAALELGLMCAVFVSEKTPRTLSRRDAIIVLGARVMPDGELSTTLLHRVQTALKAYQDGYGKLIIVCGAKGRDEPETEAGAMAKCRRASSWWRTSPPTPSKIWTTRRRR
jgi:vancomycin permeability regulator SanA